MSGMLDRMPSAVRLSDVHFRRSTWIWLAVLGVAAAAAAILDEVQKDSGCLGLALKALAINAAFVLAWRVCASLVRSVVRRTTLRLAFSYVLIGVVPIPLLAALLSLTAYILANQYMANRLRREITAVGETAVLTHAQLPEVTATRDARVASSNVSWLAQGDPVPWLENLGRPGFLVGGGHVWLAVPQGERKARLLDLTDPAAPWMQQLADRTQYEVFLELGRARKEDSGINISTSEEDQPRGVSVGTRSSTLETKPTRPAGAPPAGQGLWQKEWIQAFYLETALNAAGEKAETGRNVAVLRAAASPRLIKEQLFSQGVDEIGKVFKVAFVVVAGILLLVYLAALAVAFALAGSIARNVNRLTRATQAVARGDFSVRVNSKSRDQIGDLARAFDGMAASIQRLLVETALKERLESEIAMARTIQHKLIPPPEATLPGFSVHAHFQPVAEIGGDYYDYLPMPDGRTAVALGDVSGHGLPTGLLVAMAKAALSTLLEAGHEDGELFGRLNELIYRSTDPRHYMTLCVLAYDAKARTGVLTNAGQLAPYRISGNRIESLSLPAFPLGLFPDRSFPSRPFTFASGDLLVFFSDGLVEAVDAAEEAFGFDRFETVLRNTSTAGAAALRDALLAAVASHTGERPADDDRTLLVLTLD